jgi:hypothetical protein
LRAATPTTGAAIRRSDRQSVVTPQDQPTDWATKDCNARAEIYDRWDDLSDGMEEVTEELVATTPTTMAGVAALLAYWSEIMGDDGAGQRQDIYDTQEFLEHLAEAIGDREAR